MQELDSEVASVGMCGSQDAVMQRYPTASVDDGYRKRHVPAPTMVADFQPPYFPPPYVVSQPPTGALSAVVEFPTGPAGAQHHFSANMFGYTPGVQTAEVQPHPGLLPSSTTVDQAEFNYAAVPAGGGAVLGVTSPRRATVVGGEIPVNCDMASTAAGILHATSVLPDFSNFENVTFTPARIYDST